MLVALHETIQANTKKAGIVTDEWRHHCQPALQDEDVLSPLVGFG